MLSWLRKKPARPVGPDFSRIDTLEKAEELVHFGELEHVLLIPEEFGGQPGPDNWICAPIGVARIKAGIDGNIIRPLIEAGTVSQYQVDPEYQGDSIVPIALKIIASDPGEFTTTISIWGEALGRE